MITSVVGDCDHIFHHRHSNLALKKPLLKQATLISLVSKGQMVKRRKPQQFPKAVIRARRCFSPEISVLVLEPLRTRQKVFLGLLRSFTNKLKSRHIPQMGQ